MKKSSCLTSCLAILVLACAACGTLGCAVQEESRWSAAQSADTPEAYEAYLADYPDTPHTVLARNKLNDACFARARSADTPAAYGEYLRRYPTGWNSTQARGRMEELAFEAARGRDTIESYRQFLRDYPQGASATAARRAITRLFLPAARNGLAVTGLFEHHDALGERVAALAADVLREKGIASPPASAGGAGLEIRCGYGRLAGMKMTFGKGGTSVKTTQVTYRSVVALRRSPQTEPLWSDERETRCEVLLAEGESPVSPFRLVAPDGQTVTYVVAPGEVEKAEREFLEALRSRLDELLPAGAAD